MDYSFSINELYLLGGLLQVAGFIGLEDPFPGYLTEEIQECMETARQSLTDQGYLEIAEDGFLMDPDLMRTISTLATSPRVLVAANDDSSLYVFLDVDSGVEQKSLADGRIAISTASNFAIIIEHIDSFINLPVTTAAVENSFLIDSAILEETRNLDLHEKTSPSYIEFLTKKRVNQDTAATLSKILSMRSSKGSLVLLKRKGLSVLPQASLAWVTGDQGGWIVEPLEGNKNSVMSWKPSSTSEISLRIQTILEIIK